LRNGKIGVGKEVMKLKTIEEEIKAATISASLACGKTKPDFMKLDDTAIQCDQIIDKNGYLVGFNIQTLVVHKGRYLLKNG